MGKDLAQDRPSPLRDWFAEQHVYVRSGDTSRYVVLSRTLKLAVTIGLCLVVIATGLLSYRLVTEHLESQPEMPTVSDLDAGAKQGEATATEAAKLEAALGRAQARIDELDTALSTTKAAHDAVAKELETRQAAYGAFGPPIGSTTDIAAHWQAKLDYAGKQIQDLTAERNDLRREMEHLTAEARAWIAEAQIQGQELDAARAEVQRLDWTTGRAEATTRTAVAALQMTAAQTGNRITDLGKALAVVKAERDALTEQLDIRGRSQTSSNRQRDGVTGKAVELQAELARSDQRVQALASQRDDLQGRIEQLTATAEVWLDKLHRLYQERGAADAEAKRLNLALEQANATKRTAIAAVQRLAIDTGARIAQFDVDLAAIEAERDALAQQLESRDAHFAVLREQLSEAVAVSVAAPMELQDKLDHAAKQIQGLIAERDDLQSQIDRLTAAAATKRAQSLAQSRELDAAQAEIRRLTWALDRNGSAKEIAVTALGMTAAATGERIAELTLALTTADMDREQLSVELETAVIAAAEMTALRERATAAASEAAQMRTELEAADQRIADLDRAARIAQRELAAVRAALDQSDQPTALAAAQHQHGPRAETTVDAASMVGEVDLKQQLFATSRLVDQLYAALADARLQEMATEAAIANIMPRPPPPAPR